MRDFSGKGSLWCINPEFRAQIIDQVRKLNPTNDINKISSISYFQDVLESQKTSLSPNNNPIPGSPATNRSMTTMTSQNQIKSKGLFKRSHSALNQSQMPGAIINPKIASQLASLNRRSLVDTSSMPLDLSMNSSSQKMRNLMSTSSKHLNNMDARKANLLLKNISKSLSFIEQSGQQNQDGNSSELDAVNALLSMKSNNNNNNTRPTSTVLNPLLQFKNASQMRHRPSNESSSCLPSTSSSFAHQNKADTKSRRKQILKPPTKKVDIEKKQMNYEDFDEDELMDDDELNEFRMLDEEDENGEGGEEEVESGEVHAEMREREENEFSWNSSSNSKNNNKLKRPAESRPQQQSSKKSKKLLVKLPCFKAKKSHAQAHVNVDNDNDNDDDEPEEGELRSRSDEEAARYRLQQQQQQQHQQVVDLAHLASLKAINALLELSRAAKIIEEQKQQKASTSSKSSNNKK